MTKKYKQKDDPELAYWSDIIKDLNDPYLKSDTRRNSASSISVSYFSRLYKSLNVTFDEFISTYLSSDLVKKNHKTDVIKNLMKENCISFDTVVDTCDGDIVARIMASELSHKKEYRGITHTSFTRKTSGELSLNKKQKDMFYKACSNFENLKDFLWFTMDYEGIVSLFSKKQVKDLIASYSKDKPVFDNIPKNACDLEEQTKTLFLYSLTNEKDFNDIWFGKRKVTFANQLYSLGDKEYGVINFKLTNEKDINYKLMDKCLEYNIAFSVKLYNKTHLSMEKFDKLRLYLLDKAKESKRNKILTDALDVTFNRILTDYNLEHSEKEELIMELYSVRASIATELDRRHGVNIIKNFKKL